MCVAAIGGGGGNGDLWERPMGGERQTMDRGNDGGREQTERERGEMTQSGENLTLYSTHFHTQDLYCNMNRIQSDNPVNRQPPNPNLNPTRTANPNHRPNRTHASTDVQANQSSDKGVGRWDVSKQMYSNTRTKAPPPDEQTLSVKLRAPVTDVSSLCDERQNELQYYIAKVCTDTHLSVSLIACNTI